MTMPREINISFHSTLASVALAPPGGKPPPGAVPDSNEQRQEERSAIQRVLANMTETARKMAAKQDQNLAELKRATVELAVVVASRIVHEKLHAGDFAVESIVRAIVEELGSRHPVSVHLHPEDVVLLQRRLGKDHPVFQTRAVQADRLG